MSTQAVTFVTKKVLVTFLHPICFMIEGTAIYAGAAICEHQEKPSDHRDPYVSMPCELTIVALPDGRKISKSIQLHVGIGIIAAMVEIH